MKFRFCGDGDCPDWVLCEIHSTLSILSAIKLRLIAQIIAKSIYEEKLTNEDKIIEMFSSAKDDGQSAKSAIACIRFILMNAAIYKADEIILNTELQQLGLPKEHSGVLCRVLGEHVDAIQKNNLNNKFSINALESMKGEISKNSIDCALLELNIKNENCNGVEMDTAHKIHIHKSDLSVLLNNLRNVKKIMDTYDFEKKYSE